MNSLTTNFGLWPLVGKLLAVIGDARISTKADMSVVIERLLSISGEDYITIDRKFAQMLTTKLTSRFLILTNEIPRLVDVSGAIASRIILLQFMESFYGREDHGIEGRILKELPAILLWSLQGWKRLRERKKFIQPESGKESLDQLVQLGSPIKSFVSERCLVGPSYFDKIDNLFDAWQKWCEANNRDYAGTRQKFINDVRAVVPGLKTSRPRMNQGSRPYIWTGVCLNSESF